jgi:hypothetical protein
MAKYYINTDNERKYIKEIDYAQGKLTFTNDVAEAYKGRDGFYADATRDMIRRGFSEDYPEVINLQCDYEYY